MKSILIIEDDTAIAMALEDDFRLEGFKVYTANDGKKGLELGLKVDLDIIILDIMLPEMNGFEVCKSLRSKGINLPIIMLTAKSQEIDKVLGLEFGADDYVTKPFSPRELQARVKALLRRTQTPANVSMKKLYQFDDVKVDFNKYIVTKNNKNIKLTALEFSLLKYFLENHENVLSRNEILDNVWGVDVLVDPRAVDTHVANLRKKIEENPGLPQRLIGVRGIGYKFILK